MQPVDRVVSQRREHRDVGCLHLRQRLPLGNLDRLRKERWVPDRAAVRRTVVLARGKWLPGEPTACFTPIWSSINRPPRPARRKHVSMLHVEP